MFDLCEWDEILTFIAAFEQQHSAFCIDDFGFSGHFVHFHACIINDGDAFAHVGLEHFCPVADCELARNAIFPQFEIHKLGFCCPRHQVDGSWNQFHRDRQVSLLVGKVDDALGGNQCSILKQRDFVRAEGALCRHGGCKEQSQHAHEE